MDVEIGSRTWYPEASEGYVQRCFMKDRETSSLKLSFRTSGLQVYGAEESELWKPERNLAQNLIADEVRLVLKKFVSANSTSDPDCTFASCLYSGSNGVLTQLLELKVWFEDQTVYHLNSCSVIIVFDKEMVLKKGRSCAEVKLIDFAHVIDHNFLGGLCSFIKFVSEILTSPNGNSTNCSAYMTRRTVSVSNGDMNKEFTTRRLRKFLLSGFPIKALKLYETLSMNSHNSSKKFLAVCLCLAGEIIIDRTPR